MVASKLVAEHGVTMIDNSSKPTLGFLDTDQAAEVLHVDPKTMANWRCQKRGPRYYKIGARCFYQLEDVREWAMKQVVQTDDHA